MATDRKVKPNNLDIQIWADTGNKQFPTQAKYDAGWNFEVPIDEEENYIQNQQDAAIANFNQQGVADWDATTTYFKNSWVTYDDGNEILKYLSLTDSNIGNTPVDNDTGTANWIRIDRPSSLGQTLADSNLEYINLSVSSLVAAVDLSNVTNLNGNDPALETLANKIGNNSGTSKENQLVKTGDDGDITVDTVNTIGINLSGTLVCSSTGISNPTASTGQYSGNSVSGAVITGSGTSRDVSLYNKSAQSVAYIPTGSQTMRFVGATDFIASTATAPSGDVKGRIISDDTNGLRLFGNGDDYDFKFGNQSGSTFMQIEANTRRVQFNQSADFIDGGTFTEPSGDVHGRVAGDDVNGLRLSGNGLALDFAFTNKNSDLVYSVPTGTRNISFSGTAIFKATTVLAPTVSTGYVQASGTNGLILSGWGATQDVTIRNNLNGTTVSIPTGTTKFQHNGKSTYLNSPDQGSISGSEKGSIYGANGGGLNLQGDGTVNDVTIRNSNNTTVSILPTGTNYLNANSTVATTDNSNKYATTAYVRGLIDSIEPIAGQDSVDWGAGSTNQCTASLAVTSFQLGVTGKAVIEGWFEFYTRGTSSTGVATLISEIKNGSTVLKDKSSALNTSTGVITSSIYLNYILSGSAFQTFSSITIDLDSGSSQVNRSSVSYKVTPY